MKNFVIIRNNEGESIEIFTLPADFFIFTDNVKDGEIKVRFTADECGAGSPCFSFSLKPDGFLGRFIEDHTELFEKSILGSVRAFIANDIAMFLQNGYTRCGMEEYDSAWMSDTFVLDDFLVKWSKSYSCVLRQYHDMASQAKQTDKR